MTSDFAKEGGRCDTGLGSRRSERNHVSPRFVVCGPWGGLAPATLRALLALTLIATLQPGPEIPEAPAAPVPAVRWSAPAGCPDHTRVESKISALLGRALEPDELRMDGRIDPSPSGWTLTLTTTVGTLVDERALEANDCSVLADAAALVAVVMLDPVQAADTIEEEAAVAQAARDRDEAPQVVTPPPQTPPAEPEPEPGPDPVADPQRASQRDRAPAVAFEPRVLARVRGGGEFGAVPSGTGTFDLGLTLAGFGRAGRLRAELVGAYSIGRDATSPNATVRVHLGLLAPRVCASLPAGPLEIPLCVGLEVGAMRADSDAAGGGTSNALWLAAHAEPGLRWAFSDRVSLWAAAQVVVPMRYPAFELVDPNDATNVEAIYQPQPVAARGLIGLEFQLSGPPMR